MLPTNVTTPQDSQIVDSLLAEGLMQIKNIENANHVLLDWILMTDLDGVYLRPAGMPLSLIDQQNKTKHATVKLKMEISVFRSQHLMFNGLNWLEVI